MLQCDSYLPRSCEFHRIAIDAALLHAGPQSAISHTTALAVWGELRVERDRAKRDRAKRDGA